MSNSNFLFEMGARISTQRKKLNMTQEQLAESISISTQSLSCIELGKKAVRPEHLCAICYALNVSTDYILLGKRTSTQVDGLTKKIMSLTEEDYKMVETLVDHLKKK